MTTETAADPPAHAAANERKHTGSRGTGRTSRLPLIGGLLVLLAVGDLIVAALRLLPPLDTLPLLLSGALVIGGMMALSVLGLFIFQRLGRFHHFVGENELAGFLLAVVGVVYGILLAFVVFVVWDEYSAADQAVTAEAADMVTVYRDTQFFPATLRLAAQIDLRDYAREVTRVEWPEHGQLKSHHAPDPLNRVWALFKQVPARTPLQVAALQNADNDLYTLERQRHLRHLSGEATLPDVFWAVLILGAVFTILFVYFFHVEQFRMHVVMTAVLAGLIGSVLFLIICLNDPFTGQVHVSTYPFEHALQQFKALDMQAP